MLPKSQQIIQEKLNKLNVELNTAVLQLIISDLVNSNDYVSIHDIISDATITAQQKYSLSFGILPYLLSYGLSQGDPAQCFVLVDYILPLIPRGNAHAILYGCDLEFLPLLKKHHPHIVLLALVRAPVKTLQSEFRNAFIAASGDNHARFLTLRTSFSDSAARSRFYTTVTPVDITPTYSSINGLVQGLTSIPDADLLVYAKLFVNVPDEVWAELRQRNISWHEIITASQKQL